MQNFPPSFQPNSIGLLLTLRCNARCRHCCFECHPRRKAQMTFTKALGYIDQAERIESIKAITLTGGEVFTAYDLLRDIISAAGARGFKIRVITNGYWASSLKKARERLLPLVNCGLTTINLSHDPFHAQYVNPFRVKNAVQVALELGIEVAVAHSSLGDPQPEDAKKILYSLGLDETAPVAILQGHINPGGRAVKSFSPDQLAFVDGASEEGARLHDACSYVIREPVITPGGDLSACCGTTAATRTGFKRQFVVGNLNDRLLAELLEDLELDPLYTGLMVEGPWYFYKHLQQQAPHLFGQKKFVTICDLCAQVVCNRAGRDMIMEFLARQEPRLLIKKMMLETRRRELKEINGVKS